MFPGETIGRGAPNTCPTCKAEVTLKVLRSNAGFFIGTECNCGVYSRESVYFETREETEELLADWLSDLEDGATFDLLEGARG